MKITAVLALIVLAGCAPEATHDVAFYMDNPKNRGEKIAECKNNPGEKALMANCINAVQAEYKAMLRGRTMAGF